MIIPTEVLIVPLFSMFRALGLINSLPGLALYNVVASVSFATVILAGYFRTIPQDVIDAARVDGAGRIDVLLRIVIPLARPGIVAVAVLVAVFTWNDFGGALVLIQKPDAFTVQLALSRFSTFYATDQGLTFAGMAIAIVPPLLLFLVLQRSFIQGLDRRGRPPLSDIDARKSSTASGSERSTMYRPSPASSDECARIGPPVIAWAASCSAAIHPSVRRRGWRSRACRVSPHIRPTAEMPRWPSEPVKGNRTCWRSAAYRSSSRIARKGGFVRSR